MQHSIWVITVCQHTNVLVYGFLLHKGLRRGHIVELNWPQGYKTGVLSQTQNKVQWLAACGHVSASNQSLRFFFESENELKFYNLEAWSLWFPSVWNNVLLTSCHFATRVNAVWILQPWTLSHMTGVPIKLSCKAHKWNPPKSFTMYLVHSSLFSTL